MQGVQPGVQQGVPVVPQQNVQPPVPVINQQTIARLVQSNNTPPPQLVQQQGVQGNAPLGQLAPNPRGRGDAFSNQRNEWMLSKNNFARRVADFFQRKFASDGVSKLGVNTTNSGLGPENVNSNSGDLSKISGSPTQQTGIDTGGEVIGIMNLAGEVLAYKALQEQDTTARGKIQTHQQAQQAVTDRRQERDDAQTALNDANQEHHNLGIEQPQVQHDIHTNGLAVQQQQILLDNNQQAIDNANQTLATARQQVNANQNQDPQVIQQLQNAVTNAQQTVQNLQTQRQPLQTQMNTLTQQGHQLQQRDGDITARLQTLNANVNTAGSILKLTADLATAVTNLGVAQDNLKQLEATGALGKTTKVETTQKAYQIGQLTQKSGVVAATGIKIGADAVGVASGGATLASNVSTFVSSAGVVATGVGALSLPLDCYSLHRDRLAIQASKSMLKNVKSVERNGALQLDGTEKAFMKMMKRKLPIADKQFSAAYNSSKIIAGLGAATAVGFKIAILAGVTAGAVATGAACLTPIGWALAGVAAGVLIGYGIFKLSRFIHSKRQQKAYLETVRSATPLTTAKGQKILGKMADDYIAIHPNQDPQRTEAQYRGDVIQALSTTQGIDDTVRERAEQGLISRSRGYGVEIMTDRLRGEPNPPGAGPTHQLLTALGVKPEDLKKIVDSNNIGDAQKLLGKRLRVT